MEKDSLLCEHPLCSGLWSQVMEHVVLVLAEIWELILKEI